MIKVLIADDHALVRAGLASLLDIETDIRTVGEAVDGADALRQIAKLKPDVVVMDIMMPDLDGIAATKSICEAHAGTRVLCLTTSTSADEHRQALAAGAAGIVTKSEDNELLLAAIRKVAAGDTFISPESERLIACSRLDAQLTDYQTEILSLMSVGKTTKEIAESLGCKPTSVKDRINVICRKLGASTRTEAVAIAIRRKLLKS